MDVECQKMIFSTERRVTRSTRNICDIYTECHPLICDTGSDDAADRVVVSADAAASLPAM